jgi:hypothetical protein
MVDIHAPWRSMDRWGYIIWDRLRHCMLGIHCMGKVRTEHAYWISMHRWEYIIWDRLSQRMHGGYPCTEGDTLTGI